MRAVRRSASTRTGRAKRRKNFVLLTLGTGIGGGIVSNGNAADRQRRQRR